MKINYLFCTYIITVLFFLLIMFLLYKFIYKKEGFENSKGMKGCKKPSKISDTCKGKDSSGNPFEDNGTFYKNCKFVCQTPCPLEDSDCIDQSWCLTDKDCLEYGKVTFIPSRNKNIHDDVDTDPSNIKPTVSHDSINKKNKKLKYCSSLKINIPIDQECPFNPNLLPQSPDKVLNYLDPSSNFTSPSKPKQNPKPFTGEKQYCKLFDNTLYIMCGDEKFFKYGSLGSNYSPETLKTQLGNCNNNARIQHYGPCKPKQDPK